ncbi:WhiB family transcriptional regulator [Pseudonocardia sp. McavD-2-B]|uniref:WhiB family transcriptional regulator n=1 Tax=Pseudonocardia sp. McavD-2-B TaxID=2954499 RepID=UPI0020977D66|nr:WhiB family transcriptional regulator [Pseudonocardia sp. McavD-2-B]MCO7193957.1 WhiB family transcriptional regulator [Pseudonocardia sp. McavD-2-B]
MSGRINSGLDRLIRAATALPPVAGAACTGRAELFDDHRHGETDHDQQTRHSAALDLCDRCEAITACRAAVDQLPNPTGVWAGEVRGPRRRTPHV